MSTYELVDPELRPFLEVFPAGTITAENLPFVRQGGLPAPATIPTYPHVTVHEEIITRPQAPDLKVLVYAPSERQAPLPGLLWIHGGGYVLGHAHDDDLALKHLVSEVDCAIVSVEYRRAPETPAPGPQEDCYAALEWMYRHATELGLDPNRLAIAGASAGGGLAAGVTLMARDRGEIPLVYQLLLYPMLDDRTGSTNQAADGVGEFIWDAGSNRFAWASLLGHEPGIELPSGYFVPGRADDVSRLPPTWIGVGTLDLFLDEDLAFARRLMDARVSTELHVYPAAYHGFDWVPEAQVSRQFVRDQVEALRRAFTVTDGKMSVELEF